LNLESVRVKDLIKLEFLFAWKWIDHF
jgi:hypothetical protein